MTTDNNLSNEATKNISSIQAIDLKISDGMTRIYGVKATTKPLNQDEFDALITQLEQV